jgi:threonylcarbamoyladenosine tRNA methylthiotransferase MtaB
VQSDGKPLESAESVPILQPSTVAILNGMASFYVENFGCRAARADGEAVSARLRAEGLAERTVSDADVVVVNTCSVTAEADRDARAFVRKTRRINPTAKVVVTGCYAQRAPQELARLEGVAAVVGNSHKGLVPEIVREIAQGMEHGQEHSPLISPASLFTVSSPAQIWADDRFAHSCIEDAQVMPGLQTRPNLKIQEGCGNRCTFCVIPTTRGASRSLAAAKVLTQVRGFVAADGRELVLSGINLGRWGRDLPETRSLAELLREILNETGLPRLRLSSIEPMDWTPELITLMRDFGGSNLARHAHLPLQSGSDSVLRRMHRRYRPWHYQQKAAALLEAAGPELALGADVMAGFPGESEAEFRETYDFIDGLPFAYLHLFPFSPRPGTRGWELHRQSPVAAQAVAERMAALRNLAAEKSRRFRASFVGRSLPAITLHTPQQLAAKGRTAALTDNYLPVELATLLPANQLVEVQVTGIHTDGALLAATDTEMYTKIEAEEIAQAVPVSEPQCV